jgi:hypothetical protein
MFVSCRHYWSGWCRTGSQVQTLDTSDLCISCGEKTCGGDPSELFRFGRSKETRSIPLGIEGKGYLMVSLSLSPDNCNYASVRGNPASEYYCGQIDPISWQIKVQSLNGERISKIVNAVNETVVHRDISFAIAIPPRTSLLELDLSLQVRLQL